MKQFAYVDDGATGRVVSPEEAAHANGAAKLVWIHLDQKDDATEAFLADKLKLNHIVVSALTALETRPRCEAMGEGALINLRGLSLQDEPEADELVSIRMWIGRGCIVSVARYTMRPLPTLCDAFKAGKVKDPGDFVAMLADLITADLDPDVAELGDQLDECELMLDASRTFRLRREIAGTRAKAIEYRRFVAPQRQALERLSALDCDWLEEDDRLHLGESADRFARMAEELESIRERAALMHEQITDLRAEVIDTRALLISIVALIFLPLTFLTGLLGMNVNGIPFAHEPWAFWGVVGVCVLMAVGIAAWFRYAHWLR
ncbi:zinc transporter ZntB [Sphingomonas tabacisoli]|uniref:Zinc transporter ZntB n=1 Tax=Sphingomonas tabacisoli TaxID=2249466 RepID=A0ABW4HYX1_9SPHN